MMRDRCTGADLDGFGALHDGPVLDVGARAHHDRGEVGAKDRAVPDRGTCLDRHVTDKRCGRRDESVRMDAGRLAFEREQLHGQRLTTWFHPAVMPPSLETTVPWMLRASSLARNANRLAMSSGLAIPRAPV